MTLHRHHSVFVLLFLLLACTTCKQHKTIARHTIHSLFANRITQSDWAAKQWTGSDVVVITGKKADSENSMWVYSRWNTDSLYFFFKVEDHCLRAYQSVKDHAQLYLDDMAEVLIDTQNNKDSCWAVDDIVYHVNLLGVKKDDRGTADCKTDPLWDGNARISVFNFGTVNDTSDVDQGYMVTLAVPWTELKQKPVPGLALGVNFANGDNDGKGRQLFDWVGASPMRSPYAYGDLLLLKNN